MTPPVLDITGVSKDYHGLRPLRLERLTVSPGETVALLGLDQPAAEVLVNLVTGTSVPDAGQVILFGRPTAAITDAGDWLSVIDRIGIVSDRAVLLDQLTVMQNLAMPFTLEIEPPPPDVRERAEAIAAEVGIAPSLWPAAAGSVGAAIRARVRLGRALALAPDLLLLEHASATLAAGEAADVGRTVRTVAGRRQIAVLTVTAVEAFAREVAARVLALDGTTGVLSERRRTRWFGPRLG